MTIVFVFLALALVTLGALTHLRRRAIRRHVLSRGVRSSATTRLVRSGRGRRPRVAVSYRDIDGVERHAVKAIVSAGDGELVKRPAHVLFDPHRATRDEYVLLGFGAAPTRWFSVDFVEKGA